MSHTAANRLHYILETIPNKLHQISLIEFESRPSPDKWSKKEILGHLIDSAVNNHHRFIRAQYEHVPTITYDQNKWNELNYYQQSESSQVINLWTIYNQHLLEVIRHIPQEALRNACNTGGVENVTLQFLVNDYVQHMEHHLKQIIAYEE